MVLQTRTRTPSWGMGVVFTTGTTGNEFGPRHNYGTKSGAFNHPNRKPTDNPAKPAWLAYLPGWVIEAGSSGGEEPNPALNQASSRPCAHLLFSSSFPVLTPPSPHQEVGEAPNPRQSRSHYLAVWPAGIPQTLPDPSDSRSRVASIPSQVL